MSSPLSSSSLSRFHFFISQCFLFGFKTFFFSVLILFLFRANDLHLRAAHPSAIKVCVVRGDRSNFSRLSLLEFHHWCNCSILFALFLSFSMVLSCFCCSFLFLALLCCHSSCFPLPELFSRIFYCCSCLLFLVLPYCSYRFPNHNGGDLTITVQTKYK